MIMFNVFTGMATILAISILQIPDLELLHIADALDWVFMLLPNYDLGIGISQMAANVQLQNLCPVYLGIVPGLCDNDPDNNCCLNCN